MTQRLCPRCHNVLTLQDDNTLVYCNHCGAPQVRLSEEMREQAAAAAAAAAASLDADVPAGERPAVERVSEPHAVVWPGAVQSAALAGAVAAVLTVLSFPLPPVSLLGLFWSFTAPIVVLGVYAVRFPRTHIQTGFGARLGLLSGLSIALATLTINTVALVFARFALHHAKPIDDFTGQLFAQMLVSPMVQPSSAESAYLLERLAIPEFRVGILLSSIAISLAIYLLYSSLTGAFGGYLRSRRRP